MKLYLNPFTAKNNVVRRGSYALMVLAIVGLILWAFIVGVIQPMNQFSENQAKIMAANVASVDTTVQYTEAGWQSVHLEVSFFNKGNTAFDLTDARGQLSGDWYSADGLCDLQVPPSGGVVTIICQWSAPVGTHSETLDRGVLVQGQHYYTI